MGCFHVTHGDRAAVPTNAELADSMDKAFKSLPTFRSDIEEKVTVLGKPVVSTQEMGGALLGWGFASGERSTSVAHKAGKFRFDLRTPPDGATERARVILVEGNKVTYADPDLTRATVMDLQNASKAIDCPAALAGYWTFTGTAYASIVRMANGKITPKGGLLFYDFQFEKSQGKLVIDPKNGYQVVETQMDNETRTIIEWAPVGTLKMPAFVVSDSSEFFGAKRHIAERISYSSEVSDEMLTIKWMEGAIISNDTDGKTYQVVKGQVTELQDAATRAPESSPAKTLGGAALLVLFITTSLALAKRRLNSMPPEPVEGEVDEPTETPPHG